MMLAHLSDAQLLESLQRTCSHGRALLARLLAHLIEVEERRLDLEAACPSMLQFCVRRLGMSEDEACRRIRAARLARRFPDLLVRIERGELTLSTMALLHDALTEANYEDLVPAAAGKTKTEVQALLARRWPRPDVPAAITTIPTQTAIAPGVGLVPGPAPAAAAIAAHGPQLTPLSETRHKVQFTATDALRTKLERAQALMSHANPDGDLARIVERAVDLLLEKLEKQRLGKSDSSPEAPAPRERRSVPRPSGSGERPPARSTIPRATRRAVFERDGERCTFTDAEGHRCPQTAWLQLDHIVPRGRGGSDHPANLRVRCRAHNILYAEQTFGRDHVASRIRANARRDPRQRGRGRDDDSRFGRADHSPCPHATASYDLAASGLTHLGFGRTEVRRALDTLTARYPGELLAEMPVQILLREALAILKP